MLTAHTEDLLRRLKAGIADPADIQLIEQSLPRDFLDDLGSVYQLRFQERHLGKKWEAGVARALRFEMASISSNGSPYPMLLVIPVFRSCLFLSGEGDAITGISVATRLRAKPIHKPCKGLALTTGRGFKLDRTPDGWQLKPLEKRTVKLSDEFLQKRGWHFDALRYLAPKP